MRALYPSRQAWARAFTSKIFTAGVQTTSRVESYNNIIKHELSANSTLCNLADVLDAQFERENQWNHFFEYRTLSTCMGITTISQDLFPEVDKIMSKYLTPQILSAERVEMAQCLYFVPNKVEPNIAEEDLDVDEMNGFIEDSYDAKQIRLKSMIAEVGEENVQEVWKITDMRPENKKHMYFVKDKDIASETCCFINQEAAQNFSGLILTPNPSTVPTTVTNILRCAAKKKIKYGEVLGLARQVAQLAIEHNNHNEIVVQVDDNKENKLQQIENLLVLRRKGRPETKRYKSSTEKKPHVTYTCKTCG
ncbi:unnamed protein product [Rhizophagus irregularis]|nr:unnamed protein product [Rhizophagus irregularis]